MKKIIALLFLLSLTFSLTGTSSATTYSYSAGYGWTKWIETDNASPASDAWFQLLLPNWYDNYFNEGVIDSFAVTLTGIGGDNTEPINTFISFDGGATYNELAQYVVDPLTDFTLTMDIFNDTLLYNGSDAGPLLDVPLSSFVGYDSFWIGYACAFGHDETRLDVTASPVPEPASMLLLGSGLLGLAGLGRKKFFKK